MKYFKISTLAGWLTALGLAAPSLLFAQKSPKESAQVWVGVHAQVTASASYTVRIQSSDASEADPYNSSLSGSQTPNIFVPITPGRVYTLSFVSSSWNLADVQFNVAPGYTLFMGQPNWPMTPHTTFLTSNFGGGSGTYAMNFYVRPSDGASRVAPGYALAPRVDDFSWAVSAGTLSNGSSAGTLRWSAGSLTQALLDASALNYVDPNSDEVSTYTYSDGTIKYIDTPQVQIYVRRNSGTDSGYTIEVYGPAVGYTYTNNDPTQPWNFASQDMFEYTISNPDSSWLGRVQINRLDRASGRSDTWVLSQSGGTTMVTQTNSLRVITDTSTSGPNSGQRTEIITLADNNSNVAVKKERIYQTFPWGEELITDIADPDHLALTTSYNYYNTTEGDGHYSKLQSVVKPDGSWVMYDYYDDFAKWGELSAVYAPWQDAPSGPSQATTTNCQVTTYTYAGIRSVYQELSTGTQTSINGTTIGKTAISSTFSTNSSYSTSPIGNQPMRTDTVQSYASAGSAQTTVTTVFDATADPLYNGKIYAQINPDGTKVSASYVTADVSPIANLGNASWASTAITPDANATTRCETYLYGTAAQGDSTAVQVTNDGMSGGLSVDPIWMTPNRSYRRQIFRDPAGNPLLDMTQVYTSGGYQLVSWTECTYSADGLPLTCQKSDGELTTYSYVDGKVSDEVDPDGTHTVYTFDPLMRVTQAAHKGVPGTSGYASQADIDTSYTYDAAGHVLTTTVQGSSGGASLANANSYNLVGLPVSQTDATGLTSTLAYANGGQTVTTTIPGGATQVANNYLDGSSKSVTGTGVVSQYVTRTVNSDGTVTTQVNVGTSNSSRLATSTTDWLGRTISQSKPAFGGGTMTTQAFYNTSGQLVKVTQPGMAPTLYQYDGLGQLQYAGLDVNNNGTLDLGGTDRITQTRTQIVNQNGAWWTQSQTYVYNQASSSTPLLQSKTLQKLVPYDYGNGNYSGGEALGETDSYDLYGNLTVQKTVANSANAVVTQTTNFPNSSSPQVSVSYNGLLVSQTTAQNITTTAQYDSLGRQIAAVDPRTGTSQTGYYTSGAGSNSQVAWSQDAAGNRTNFTYDSTDELLASSTDPLGNTVYHGYDYLGHEIKTWGTATYPVAFAFDSFGEKVAQRTFGSSAANFGASSWPLSDDGGDPRNPNPGSWTSGDKTTWAYDAATGFLTAKTDPSNSSVALAYNAAGQLSTRTWARGVTTTYSYDPNTGEQTGISYSDGTPSLSYAFNRLGQSSSVTDVSGSRSFAYSPTTTELQSESLPSYFASRILTRSYDTSTTGALGRNIGFSLGTSSALASDEGIGYGYDTYGRLNGIALTGGPSFVYGYAANSNLVASITDSADNWSQTRTWLSNRNLLAAISTSEQSTTIGQFQYAYDAIGRRTSKVSTGTLFSRYQAGGLADNYTYDSKSQLTGDATYQSTDPTVTTTPVLGRTLTYAYDQIGSRTSSSVDGAQTTYSNNSLNQLTSRTVPGYDWVSGFAPTGATVSVNGTNLTSSQTQGQYWLDQVSESNSSTPNWTLFMIGSSLGGSSTRGAFLAQSPEAYTYDADGNLLQDGRWHYFWDGENRLTAMETYGHQPGDTQGVWNSGVPLQRLQFQYDYLGRRISKQVYSWSGSAFQLAYETRFVYDGDNLIADYSLSGSTLTVFHTYAWGIDISGGLHADGGVGGLLAMTTASGAINLPTFDGNGNVMGLVDRASGAITAAYEYSPFGETLRSTGIYAQQNPFRFSTEFTDDETQLIYYERRYYNPRTGRWLSRDPKEELGGLHLYAFVSNNAINRWDYLGMDAGPAPAGYVWTVIGGLGMWIDPSVPMFYEDNGSGGGFSSEALAYGGMTVFDDHLALIDDMEATFAAMDAAEQQTPDTASSSSAPSYDNLIAASNKAANQAVASLKHATDQIDDPFSGQPPPNDPNSDYTFQQIADNALSNGLNDSTSNSSDNSGTGAPANPVATVAAASPENSGPGADAPPVASGSTASSASTNGGPLTTVPQDAQSASDFLGQSNSAACGPTAAWNALIYLEGAKAITQNNQVLYDKFSADARQAGGESNTTITNQFNAFAAGTPYQATLTRNIDPFDLAENATSGTMPFIGDFNFGGLKHAQVYVPQDSNEDIVISSTTQGAYTWTMSSSAVGSGIYRAAPKNSASYSVVQIGRK